MTLIYPRKSYDHQPIQKINDDDDLKKILCVLSGHGKIMVIRKNANVEIVNI